MPHTNHTLTHVADQLRVTSRKKFALGTERLQAGDDVLALLSIHGALEDGLRAALAREGVETGAWPDLIDALCTEAEPPLSDKDADRLRRVNRLRNGVAHGESLTIDHMGIVSYSQFAAKLLRTYGVTIDQPHAARRTHTNHSPRPTTRRSQMHMLLQRSSNVLVPAVVALLVFAIGLWALNSWLGRSASTPTRVAGPIIAATSTQPTPNSAAPTSDVLANQAAVLVASPLASTAAPQAAVPGAIAVGGRAIITTSGDPLNLRSQPNQGADSTILATLTSGTAVEIIDGPQQADGYTWWRVRAGDQEGWCAGEFLTVQAGP